MNTRSGRDFAIPVFRGGRFEDASLPVDVLPDLAAYRDLIVELAKHLFLQRQPGRRRVPKGFIDSFELGIRAIQPGSTVAVLERRAPPSRHGTLLQATDDFEHARDLVDAVLEAGTKDAPLPPEFPPHLTRYFNQFGRGLRDDEHLELRRPGATTGPRLDRTIRKRLIVRHEPRYENAVDMTARINGGVIKRGRITLELENGALVDGDCSESLVRQALALAEQRVRVVGVGAFDRGDRLEALVRVHDVIPLDEEEAERSVSPLDRQFAELAALVPGWFEHDTPALDAEGLRAAQAFLSGATAQGVPVPHLYPTPEAEARAEWSLGAWEVSATFDLGARNVRLHATHLDTDASEAAEMSLTSEGALDTFVRFVRQISPTARGS